VQDAGRMEKMSIALRSARLKLLDDLGRGDVQKKILRGVKCEMIKS
jgi:hypothetical protein